MATRLKFSNNARSVLADDMTPTDTVLTVEDASLFPVAPFRITIDAEIMEVRTINKDSNLFADILRGLEDTTPASHVTGAYVENRMTAGFLTELLDAPIRGSSAFKGPTGVVITHDKGHTDFQVVWCATSNPAGHLGEVWYEKTTTTVKICNSGDYTGGFDYVLW